MFHYSQFMREFAAVWKWTVEQRKGVFSSSAKAPKMQERPPPIPVKQHSLLIEVHLTLLYSHIFALLLYTQVFPIQFLTARFDVVSTRNTAQVCAVRFQCVNEVNSTKLPFYRCA